MKDLDLNEAVAAAIAQDRALDDQIVHLGFTRRQLREAFDASLAPGANWKAPIQTIASAEDRDLIVAALEFFVGGPTTVTPRVFTRKGEQMTLLIVENRGYWENIGG